MLREFKQALNAADLFPNTSMVPLNFTDPLRVALEPILITPPSPSLRARALPVCRNAPTLDVRYTRPPVLLTQVARIAPAVLIANEARPPTPPSITPG